MFMLDDGFGFVLIVNKPDCIMLGNRHIGNLLGIILGGRIGMGILLAESNFKIDALDGEPWF